MIVHLACKLSFNGLNAGQTRCEFAGQGPRKLIGGDADRFVDVAQRIFGDDAVFRLAQDEADSGRVLRVTELLIHDRAIKIHLACIFRLEAALLQINDDEAA